MKEKGEPILENKLEIAALKKIIYVKSQGGFKVRAEKKKAPGKAKSGV